MSSEPFLIREFDRERDYGRVCGWWKGHGWDAVPLAALPKLGAFAHRDGRDTAAAWLYMDNSVGVCMLEWLVTDPEAKPRDALRAINRITDFFTHSALAMDYGVMLATCRQASLAKVHGKNGFHKTDEGMIHLIKFLKETR